MQVPFGDMTRHYLAIQAEIDAAVSRVLHSGWFVLGHEVQAFEAAFAHYLGVRHAIGVGSGTEALHLALVASGIQPGDEVLTVPNTAVPTLSAISFAQAIPVMVDIEPDSFCIDVRRIEEKITPRTRAIIPVHLYGNACRIEEVMAIARHHNLTVIEDACQAHGARRNGRIVGTLGAYGCYSFYPSKNLGAFGDGGMVVTDDDARAQQILLLRNYGQIERYYHEIKGFNSRLDDMQAAILAAQLPHLEEWNRRRREIAALYDRAITHPGITLPRQQEGSEHVYHLYVVRCSRRDALRRYLADHGIGTQIHYPVPCHLQNAYRDLGAGPGTCPVAEQYAGEVLSLPIYPEMRDEEVLHVAATINQFEG
ncbi:MAG TPA: DegT/DnrJ/EryC1/StrS family aminotransferase [bacterium]|nr:DegT/DnrJ/EryC1/StrS family aminotransferase [bacterium]HPR87826.1 DegT/DnrJ/EryC1/StrS family aminotransferase [bacterium]